MSKVALITVIHDPTGRNIRLLKEVKNELEEIYSDIYITISDESSPVLIKEIEGSSFNGKVIPKKGAAHARREAVKFGLMGDSLYFHYCDFDRILTWGKKYLEELKRVVLQIPNHDYLIFGRTERALHTHPIEWVETEKITNKIFSLEYGKEVDITAGSCSFSKKCAVYIDKHSKEKMTDAEWAMIAFRIAKLDLSYLAVEGLEYEEDINSINRTITDAEKWLGRLKLSYIISETACKTGK